MDRLSMYLFAFAVFWMAITTLIVMLTNNPDVRWLLPALVSALVGFGIQVILFARER